MGALSSVKRRRTARLAKLASRAYYLHRKRQDDRMYAMICDEFIALGGVYIKFLQGVLLRSEMMRRWNNPARLKVFESLDSEPINAAAILQYELGKDWNKHIVSLDPQPFAAGSFGQVYYGKHADGRPVAIKILRPMVRELLKYDLKLLSAFTRRFFLKILVRNMDVNLNEAIKDFRAITLRETDYVQEVAFATELYEVYENHPSIVIPKTYTDLCTPNIIVQEYIDGISVAKLLQMQEQGVDPRQYVYETMGSDIDRQLISLGYESLYGAFYLPRIHGDPHPGNIKLLPGNRVGIIDFGISARTPNNQPAFFGLLEEWNLLFSGQQNIPNLFEQFIRFFVSDLYRALKRLSTMRYSTIAEQNYVQDIGRIAHKTINKNLSQQDMHDLMNNGKLIQVVNRIVNKQNRFGLIMRLEEAEMLRAAQTYITMVESLKRREVVLPQVFQLVVQKIHNEHPNLRHEGDESVSVGAALEIINSWLERVAERDPVLFQQLRRQIR